jgi:adenylosuccinate synthase
VSLAGFLSELEMLAGIGVDVTRIKISDRAHVVFPYHGLLDRAEEAARGGSALGTTGRGIGPAYVDRTARRGITFGELRNPDFVEHLRVNAASVAKRLPPDLEPLDAEALVAQARELLPRILPHVVDGVAYLHGALERDRRVLLEGAQGSLLDIGYGTYPFVTSSQTIAGGACAGLGLGPTQVGSVVGIAKAYCTRVGAGPFPSELRDAVGERMRERGREFGTVTGRPRRCGWFDGVAARYASRINGLTSAVLTKLDVLSGIERLGVVTGYEIDGAPAEFSSAADPRLKLVLEWHEGWDDDLAGCRKIAALPASAQAYVRRLEELLDAPFDAISVGAERQELATV